MLLLFKLLISLASISFGASETFTTESYEEISALIEQESAEYSQDELLVVFDLDETVLRTFPCKKNDRDINGFLFFEYLVRKCGAQVTSPIVTEIISTLKEQEYPVMALTARRASLMSATFIQLEEALYLSEEAREELKVTFETAPGYSEELDTIEFEQEGKKKTYIKEITSRKGVSFVSGADKGLALQAYLAKNSETTFKRIIFIDDNIRNVKNLMKAYKDTEESLLMIHYREFDH